MFCEQTLKFVKWYNKKTKTKKNKNKKKQKTKKKKKTTSTKPLYKRDMQSTTTMFPPKPVLQATYWDKMSSLTLSRSKEKREL